MINKTVTFTHDELLQVLYALQDRQIELEDLGGKSDYTAQLTAISSALAKVQK